ncbi:MAG: M56 family metallopeptidase [Ginsengibacter sp.]
MIPYILYASLILTACLIFYKLLLQKETFFYLNRFVLLLFIILAFILPVIHIPQEISFRKAAAPVNLASTEIPVDNNTTASTAQNAISRIDQPNQKNQSINLQKVEQWLIYLYWFGVVLCGLNFLMQAVALLYKAYSRPVIRDGKFRIVEIQGDKAPCSFGNNIFINPGKYDWETYNQVLLHEKIHIGQKHTFDLVLGEITLIFQWFNPFAWLWRKELENNLEFFTDRKVLQYDGVKKESYQLSLLKVAAPHFPLSLTTNYNQSLLKKRIVMMNAKKSNVHTTWKYFFLLPLMVLFVCLFNEPVVKSQSTVTKTNQKAQPAVTTGIQTEGNWFATIKDDKVNVQFKSAAEEKAMNGTTFLLKEFKDLPRDIPGVFSLKREAGTIEFTGKFDGDKGMGQYKFISDNNYNDDMHKEGIDVTGDKDIMVFFLVNLKRSYVPMLKKNGYTQPDKDKLIPLAALDVSEDYIKSIKEAGFPDISLDDLVPFKALNVDKAYINEIRNSGYKDITPEKIITFKAQGIDGKYIADFRDSDKTRADINTMNTVRQHVDDNSNKTGDVTADKNKNDEVYVMGKKKDKDEDDIIAFKALKIDHAFINSFKEIGYNDLSNSDLISFKALNVTPEYAITFRNAGYNNIKADELVSLKAQEVTPAVIKEYRDLGFANVTLDDVIGAKATGTSPTFIKSMREKGHNMKSLEKYIALKSVLGN